LVADGQNQLRPGSKVLCAIGLVGWRSRGRPDKPGAAARVAATNNERVQRFIRRPGGNIAVDRRVFFLLSGLLGYRQLPVSALPQVDYPTIVVATACRCQCGNYGLGGGPRRSNGSSARCRRSADDIGISFGNSQSRAVRFWAVTSTRPSRMCRPPSTRPRNLLPTSLPAPPPTARATRLTRPFSPWHLQLGYPRRSIRSTMWLIPSWRRRSRRWRGGLVTINGGQKPAVRVQVDPRRWRRRAQLERRAKILVAANVNQPKETWTAPPEFTPWPPMISSRAARVFRPLVLAYNNGAPSVCRSGQRHRRRGEQRLAGWSDGKRAIIVSVRRQPGLRHRVADR